MTSPLRRALPALLALGAALVLPGPAAADRAATLRALDALMASSAPGLGLEVNRGVGEPISIGDVVQYRIRSDRDAYITLLHVDANGVLTVMQPSSALPDNRVKAGVEKRLPDPESGIEIEAEPPLGLESIYAIATEEPLAAPGLRGAAQELKVLDVGKAPIFADELARALRASGQRFQLARLEQRIIGRSGTQYNVADITNYFTTRTRSIKRPKLDLKIHFHSGSDELDAEAKRELDVFGSALGSPALEERRFSLSGHTDDIGPDEFNLDLSRRRAEKTMRYLVEEAGIDPKRVKVEAYGEAKPKEPNTSDATRAENRRVEFTLLP